jgi:phosphopantothenoylcysteine synthetase/decarboxylase
VVAPVSKRLACGDVGVGGLAEVADIVAAVEALLP